MTTHPNLDGDAAFEAEIGLLSVEGLLANRGAAGHVDARLVAAGLTTGGGDAHGALLPEFNASLHYRFRDAPFADGCTGILGSAMRLNSGEQRGSSANSAGIGPSGGIACNGDQAIFILTADAGIAATLLDGILGSSATRTPIEEQGAGYVGLNVGVATDGNVLVQGSLAHLFLADGESVTTGELRASMPVIQFSPGFHLNAGVYGRAMRRSDLPDGEVGGVAAGVLIGTGYTVSHAE